MAEENQANNQNPAPEQVQVPSTRTNISIRTMQSDIESLRESGGAHPMAEVVSVGSDSSVQEPGAVPAPAELPRQHRNFSWIFWIIGLVILFLVGYYVIPLFYR